MFDAIANLCDLLLRRPSLVRSIKRKDRVSYPPSWPLRHPHRGYMIYVNADAVIGPYDAECDPEVERGMQRALDRVFGPDSAPGPGDSDE